MKVYIAAAFFTPEQLSVVMSIESALEVNGIEYFSPRSEGTLKDMSIEERKAMMSGIFRFNVAHMDWCTHCIAVIDDYDTGTVWEMGYLYATKKVIVTMTSHYHGINVMLNESIFAHTDSVESAIKGILGKKGLPKTGDVT